MRVDKDSILWVRKFSVSNLFNSKPVNQEFDRVVKRCLYEKRAIQLNLLEGQVEVMLLKNLSNQKCLELEGVSLVGMSDAGVSSPGARLILPLTMSVSSIYIPVEQINSIRRGERSIAEFFTRNLFMALASDDANVILRDDEPIQNQVKLSNDLMIRYLWILRYFLEDNFLSAGFTVEKLLLNLFIECDLAESKLLNFGITELRGALQSNFSNSPENMRREYNNVRQKVLSCL